jgi:S1-C subfamily serine protease
MTANILQQLNNEMSARVEQVRDSLVHIHNGRGGTGAGTIWHPDGLIVTNAHVIQQHPAPKVTLPDGRTLPGRLLAEDTSRDLAAIAVEASGLPTIEVGQSTRLRPGQWVLALGHPWGVAGAVTAGAIIDIGPPPEMLPARGEFIQVGLPLRPGHSGGPLVDVAGRLIGINTMITGPEVGLAIPIHVVKNFLRQKLGTSDEDSA